MGGTVGQRIGEVIIVLLSPLIIALMIVISVVIFIQVVVVYLGWEIVFRLDRIRKKASSQSAS